MEGAYCRGRLMIGCILLLKVDGPISGGREGLYAAAYSMAFSSDARMFLLAKAPW